MRIKPDERLSDEALYELAKEASERAYCPYSNYAVGVALECDTGWVYLGSNVENASYGATVCAERVALCEAVLSGERRLLRIAIYGKRKGERREGRAMPCGICRQALSEFDSSSLIVITGEDGLSDSVSFSSILPYSFTKDSLNSFTKESLK